MYNSSVHHRKSIRIKGYDYSKAGAYFITICADNHKCVFGDISVENSDQMNLNTFGKIAHDEWLKLPERFPNFELDVFQIMPNHMHGIVVWNDIVDRWDDRARVNRIRTVGEIVGAYK